MENSSGAPDAAKPPNDALTANLQYLLDCAKRQEELYKHLSTGKCRDCLASAQTREDEQCAACRSLQDECSKLRERLATSVSTALAAYGAVEQVYQSALQMHTGGTNVAKSSGDADTEEVQRQTQQPDSIGSLLGKNSGLESGKSGILGPFAENYFVIESPAQTYEHGKQISPKWPKVFKWERADVAGKECSHLGLSEQIPDTREVARYLRVPEISCGGSSPDSMVSSSSGPLLSDTGCTPGTMSSASSMDDLLSNFSHSKRRNSAQSDLSAPCPKVEPEKRVRRISKVLSIIEPLSEELTVPSLKGGRKGIPPKPLVLDYKQDLSDADTSLSSIAALRSPNKVNSAASIRARKISSPGNSSVPSSPSRNSDFFVEFESEDFSSGDGSEPTSPNGKSIQRAQKEINRRYQLLQKRLDKEFAEKQRQWEKQKSNPNRAITIKTPPKSEEQSPNPVLGSNLSAEFLEENLTPDFKKKLRKWRVKKESVDGRLSPSFVFNQFPLGPASPNREKCPDSKVKIDWNLWKSASGTDQKCLPDEFQRKLEQWDKMKRNGRSSNDSFKRTCKSSSESGSKKSTDEERAALGSAKQKALGSGKKNYEKEKLEKLSKLNSAMAEVEVKTSIGVIKFEGISRKFTRKLYEWEKARGIGPESSTFALLHPGYCPIDVNQIAKECRPPCNGKHSPTLSRSLSLDSVQIPNSMMGNAPLRASSLSLNNLHELRDVDIKTRSDELIGESLTSQPQAVYDLRTRKTQVDEAATWHNTPQSNGQTNYNSKRTQNLESFTNLAPLLSVLKHTDEVLDKLQKASPDIMENMEIKHCLETLAYIRLIYPHYSDNLMKPKVLNAILDVQAELERITNLSQRCPLDEACCQEIMEERNNEYNEEFMGLRESLELLRSGINGGCNQYHMDAVPDINVTSEDGLDSSVYAPTTVEATTDDFTCSERAANQNSVVEASNAGGHSGTMGSKKKLRLRKVGSRQNSKTESSDSSDTESSSVVDTPRRLKRKVFRAKPKSLEETEMQKFETDSTGFSLQLKTADTNELREDVPKAPALPSFPQSTEDESMQNAIVFVKTKRKVFTTIRASGDGIAVIECDVENAPKSEAELPTVFEEEQLSVGKQEGGDIRPSLSKSFSYNNLTRSPINHIQRRFSSAEQINKLDSNTRQPLASDSLQTISRPMPKQPPLTMSKTDEKPHLYKKNSEKSLSGSTLRKIGSKIVKSFQSSHRDERSAEGKSKETAESLQKAKDQLLQTVTAADKQTTPREMRRVSCSDIKRPKSQLDADIAEPSPAEDGNLLKSVSADTFNQATSNPLHRVGSESRVVTRSGKLSSKLGFATLASKFRRSKYKKDSRSVVENASLPEEAASQLLDTPGVRGHAEEGHTRDMPVTKSHSSPVAVAITEESSAHDHKDTRPVNKSQSDEVVLKRNRF